MADFEANIEGADALAKALREVAPKLRAKVIRGALRKGGNIIKAEAKQRAPVLKQPHPNRKPGTVRDAIAVRSSKQARQAGDEGVFVNVRPAKGAKFRNLGTIAGVRVRAKVRASQRGAQSRNDPYYWRFVEFGTARMRAQPFLRPAADAKGRVALDMVVQAIDAGLKKLDKGAL